NSSTLLNSIVVYNLGVLGILNKDGNRGSAEFLRSLVHTGESVRNHDVVITELEFSMTDFIAHCHRTFDFRTKNFLVPGNSFPSAAAFFADGEIGLNTKRHDY